MWPSPACGVAKLRDLGETPELHLQPSLCLVILPTQPVGQSPLSVEAEVWTLHMVSALPGLGPLKDGYLVEGHQAG